MEGAPIDKLIYSLLALPVTFMIFIWIKKRRDAMRDEEGQIEYKSVGQAVMSFVFEGIALVVGLSVLITGVTGILGFVIHVVTHQ